MNSIHSSIRKRFCFITTGLLAVALWGCGDSAKTQTVEGNDIQSVKAVTVGRVESRPPVGKLEYVGVLSADREADVSSESGGTIERILFEKGDTVKKDQLLAEISTRSIRLEVQQAQAALKAVRSQLEKTVRGSRPEEILIAKAALQAAQAQRHEAEKHFSRIENLFRAGSVSDSAYESAKRAVETAKAQDASARQQLELAEQGPRREDRQAARAAVEQAAAALALAKDRLRKSRLSAPFAGIVAVRDVEPGEVVAPGTIITKIVDLSRMKIKLSVSEKDLLMLRRQQQFSFTVDAIPGETFTCRLFFISPSATVSTRSFPVEMQVQGPDPRMADGMTVRVDLPLTSEPKTIKIPSAWLTEESGQIGLFVIKDDRAFFQAVTLGAYYDQRVEILSGLDGAERVITNPSGIKTGDTVRY